jgi:hypothetical protein
MLASDLIMDVRASRTISPHQMERLEKMVFGNGRPSGDQLDLLYLMDTYLQRPDGGASGARRDDRAAGRKRAAPEQAGARHLTPGELPAR